MSSIDFGLVGSIFTVLVMVFFVGIVAWTFSKRNKAGFEEASKLVFDDETPPPSSAERNTFQHNGSHQ